MAERDETERLDALAARIAKAKAALDPPKPAPDHHTMAQVGWRMVVELVAGLGVGAAIGYGLDVLMGTGPLMLVTLTLLGFAAGVKAMLRSAQELRAPEEDKAAPDKPGVEREDRPSG